MNLETLQLLNIYFGRNTLEGQVYDFARFYEEGPGSANLEPSLSHAISLLNEINQLKLNKIMNSLETKKLSEKFKELTKKNSQDVDAICGAD